MTRGDPPLSAYLSSSDVPLLTGSQRLFELAVLLHLLVVGLELLLLRLDLLPLEHWEGRGGRGEGRGGRGEGRGERYTCTQDP